MTPQTAAKLIEKLVSYDRGRILACNLVDSVNEGVISATDLKNIIDWWRHSLPLIEAKQSPKKKRDALLETFDLLRLEPNEWKAYASTVPGLLQLGEKPEFRLCGLKKRSSRLPRSNLATAMPAEAFFNHLAAGAKTAILGNLNLVASPEESIVKWDEGGIQYSASKDHLKPNSRLGMKGGLAWFTKTEEIQTNLKNRDADGLRDALGLFHIGSGVHLVVLLFEPTAMTANKQGRPSALEAGGGKNSRFMCRASGNRLTHDQTWGQTADLARFAGGESDIDGVPERVTHPLEASQFGSIRVHAVGRSMKNRGKTKEDSDSKFAEFLARGRDSAQIQQTILNLIT